MDVLFALAGLFICALPMLAVAAMVRLTFRAPAVFSQQRVGRGGRLFRIFKFRSMKSRAGEDAAAALASAEDERVTRLGRVLRRYKADELPQLYNILRGEMALIGPRPKLLQYTGIPRMPYRPGLTGAATLVFHREGELLRGLDESSLDEFYSRSIKPVKTRLDVCSMCQATFASDCSILLRTALNCFCPSRFLEDPPRMPIDRERSLPDRSDLAQDSVAADL